MFLLNNSSAAPMNRPPPIKPVHFAAEVFAAPESPKQTKDAQRLTALRTLKDKLFLGTDILSSFCIIP
jgi:hypothetical protein